MFQQHGARLFPREAHLHQAARLALVDGRVRVLGHPLAGVLVELLAVALVLVGDHGVLGVVGLGGAEQGLQGEQGGADGEGGRPLVLEDVEADGAGLGADVGVPDLGLEAHLGRLVGVLGGQADVDVEDAALVDGVLGAEDVALPVAEVAAEERDLDVGLLRLSHRMLTVLAKSSYSFFTRRSFFISKILYYY